ncbi:MAG: hypothetical protein QOE55_1250, partial [Acidobacteriaceae bacterium]|nr:hypothetical protein [Acidobacteriaceae bacterium]
MPRVWAEAQLQSVSGYKRLIGDRSRETLDNQISCYFRL